MKVKDLIRDLSGYNPELQLILYHPNTGADWDNGAVCAHFIHLGKVQKISLREEDYLSTFSTLSDRRRKHVEEEKIDINKDYIVFNLDEEDWLRQEE